MSDREWGWNIFKSIVEKCKTESGFAQYRDVHSAYSSLGDEAPSYFVGKTMKFFYLLFSTKNVVTLGRTLFTTGGHMLPIFEQ